jgi:hypothetical protein
MRFAGSWYAETHHQRKDCVISRLPVQRCETVWLQDDILVLQYLTSWYLYGHTPLMAVVPLHLWGSLVVPHAQAHTVPHHADSLAELCLILQPESHSCHPIPSNL